MKKFFALLNARNKEFYRDRGTLVWTFIFPFIVIAGFAFGYNGNSDQIFKVGLLHSAGALSQDLHSVLKPLEETRTSEFVELKDEVAAIKSVQMHQLDLLVKAGSPVQYWVNPDSAKGRLIERLLVSGDPAASTLQKQTVTGRGVRYVEWLIPGILAMNMMFSSLFGVGYAIVRYRKNGVLKRLKATPVTAFQFLSAQLVSRLLLILATSSIVFFGAIKLVGFQMQGSYGALFIYLAVGACCMISLGLAVASRIASEELAEGILNLLTWPMMFLSGIWFSLEGASKPILYLAKIFPLTYIVSGARQIMIEGTPLSALLPSLITLGLMGGLLLIIGSFLFKWE